MRQRETYNRQTEMERERGRGEGERERIGGTQAVSNEMDALLMGSANTAKTERQLHVPSSAIVGW